MRLALVVCSLAWASALSRVPRASSRAPRAPSPRFATFRHPLPSMSAQLPPSQLPPSGTKLDEFLQLLGRCYAFAGAAHAVDFGTGNALPAAAGLPPFAAIGTLAQAMGVLWCLLGLVQLVPSERSQRCPSLPPPPPS